MKHTRILSVAAVIAITGCASTDDMANNDNMDGAQRRVSSSECISPRGITNWHAIGDTHIHLEAAGNHDFLVEVLGACPGLDIANAVALRNSGWLCGKDIGELTYRDAGIPRRCRFTNIASVVDRQDAIVKAKASQQDSN